MQPLEPEPGTNHQAEAPTVRIAAVQFEGVLGDVAANLDRLDPLVREAAAGGARIVALPEFFTSRIAFDPRVHDAVLPPDNEALAWMKGIASQHGCAIGGSMLVAEGGAITNRYHFVEPDGRVHLHDKDLPTMWENAAYGPGHDDGAFETGFGGIGAAMCWELIRTQTARRLRGRVGLAVTGTHWWTLASNWGRATTSALAPLALFNRYLSENAPVEFARRLGAPVVQASHCGTFRSGFLLVPGSSFALPYDTEYVGATQIVDADGRVLAARPTADGPGIVTAEVRLGSVAPRQSLEARFWIPDLPLSLRTYWHQQNACAKSYYEREGRAAGLAVASRRKR